MFRENISLMPNVYFFRHCEQREAIQASFNAKRDCFAGARNFIVKAIFMVLSLFLITLPCKAQLAVIAHPTQEINRITYTELYRLYTGKTKKLNNKNKVVVLDQKPGSSTREEFYRLVLQSSEPQMKAYWARIVFAGRGIPLRQEKDDSAVKALVAKEPTYIGYIDKTLVDDSVKVLFTLRDFNRGNAAVNAVKKLIPSAGKSSEDL